MDGKWYVRFPFIAAPSFHLLPRPPLPLTDTWTLIVHNNFITPQPHGRAWKIHNKDLLVTEVIPKYFVLSKYESFTRQLNGWGFKRLIQAGNDFNAYYHECFLRGHPHLTSFLSRVPANLGKLLPHVEGEPNFYEIARDFPLQPPPDLRMMSYPQQSAYPKALLPLGVVTSLKEQLQRPMQKTETGNHNEFVGMPGFSPRGLVGGYATFPDNQYQYPMQQYGYGSLPPQNSHYNMLPPPGRPLTGDVTSQSYHPDTTMRKVSTLSSTNEDETNETDLQEMKLTDSTK